MPLATIAILLPTLFWDQSVETAQALRKAGIERLYVPAGRAQTWQKLGFQADEFDRAHAVQAVTPKVEYHMDVASATRVPWVDANGWRFIREPARSYFYDLPVGSATLATAEAYAYGVNAAIRAAPDDLPALARMLSFLGQLDRPRMRVRANIGVIDDGSDTMGEVLNLLSRHNLLFQVIPATDPKYDLNVHHTDDAANPYEFAMKVRRQLTDEKRLLRIYGSNVVLARLTGEGSQARVDLLNYGRNPVRGLRVRVLGECGDVKLYVYGHPDAALQDYTVQDNATEFTIPEMGPYAAVDCRADLPVRNRPPGRPAWFDGGSGGPARTGRSAPHGKL